VDDKALKTLREHAHLASPAFGVGDSDRDGRGGCPSLGLRWGQHFALQLPADERLLSRWFALSVMCMVEIDPQGLPAAASKSEERSYGQVFKGSGAVNLTSKRLIGVLMEAQGLFGDFDARGDRSLVFALPLTDMATVTLTRQRGAFSLKDKGLIFNTARGGDLFIDFDRVVDERDVARKQDKAAAMMTILRAAADAQRPGATAAHLALIDAALAGRWTQDEDDSVATLLPQGVAVDVGAAASPDAGVAAGAATPPEAGAAAPFGYCRGCGKALEDDALFCGYCGRRIAGP